MASGYRPDWMNYDPESELEGTQERDTSFEGMAQQAPAASSSSNPSDFRAGLYGTHPESYSEGDEAYE